MVNKIFSIGINKKKSRNARPSITFFIYALLFLIAFWCVSFYSNITNILFGKNALDIFTEDLQTLSLYFLPIDKDVSAQIYKLDKIVQSYEKGENIFKTNKSEIEDIRGYVNEHSEYLASLGFERYEGFMNFLSDLYNQREEVYDLLGENQTYNYLIPLQNGNEKRPNGGFFGSFAFVSISGGHIQDLEVIDSYLADYIAPTSRINLPSRYSQYFGEKQLGFVAGNKFGFTNMDGKNLKILYEKSFNSEYEMSRVKELYNGTQRKMLHNKFIKGVVFLDSSLISELLPAFNEKMWEWQFVNASIDIIRGENRTNKKEIYIKDVMNYFYANVSSIAKNLINNWDDLISKRYIQVYLSEVSVSSDFQNLLYKYKLNTQFDSDNIYARDVNIANNKSDDFITKWLKLYSAEGDFITSQQDNILNLSGLSAGEYQLIIDYYFFVPEMYRKFISKLEEKYNINITDREKGILVINPVNHFDGNPERMRWNKGIIYYPQNVEILSVDGNVENVQYFKSDFSQGLNYTLRTTKAEDHLQAVINFRITK